MLDILTDRQDDGAETTDTVRPDKGKTFYWRLPDACGENVMILAIIPPADTLSYQRKTVKAILGAYACHSI